jgi:DUF971 family protein
LGALPFPCRMLAARIGAARVGGGGALQATCCRRELISLWQRRKRNVDSHDDESGMGVPKAFVDAFDKLDPRRYVTNGHVRGPPLQARRSAVNLADRFRNGNWTQRRPTDATHANPASATAEAPAETEADSPRPPPVAFDVDETGRAKAVPVDIVLIRKRTALRITWRVPTRTSADGQRVAAHQPAAITEDASQRIELCPPAAYDDVVIRTELRTVSAELLRAEAPSTDVKGAGVLVYGKRGITITEVMVVGNYAVRVAFSDGHDAGIFPYGYLYELCVDKWPVSRAYIERLRETNRRREPKKPIAPAAPKLACGTRRLPSAASNVTAESVPAALHGRETMAETAAKAPQGG